MPDFYSVMRRIKREADSNFDVNPNIRQLDYQIKIDEIELSIQHPQPSMETRITTSFNIVAKAIKRVAIFQIRFTRFNLLFYACLYPETGAHFRETCFSDSEIDLKLLSAFGIKVGRMLPE